MNIKDIPEKEFDAEKSRRSAIRNLKKDIASNKSHIDELQKEIDFWIKQIEGLKNV